MSSAVIPNLALDRRHERPESSPRQDVPVRLEVRVGSLDGDGADLQRLGKLADRRQAVVGLEVARRDGVLDLVGDLLVHRVRVAG
jgi:hypothetical protein